MAKKIKCVDVDRGVAFGDGSLSFIAGPCVIESRKMALDLAARLVEVANDLSVNFVFKASFDKANRTSVDSYRGPGIEEGLDILAEIRSEFEVPVITDVHEPWQCSKVAEVCDILQIPAFLARQTDLVVAAGETGAVINVKKGQFMAPEDMTNVIKKIESTGNKRIVLCERGASFGYRNLVADMRSLLIMRETGYPVVFDATHSVQRPGGLGTGSGGDGKFAPALARAAVATGVDGVFMETHVNPAKALSDASNAIAFKEVKNLWKRLLAVHAVGKGADVEFDGGCSHK
jgi:2-dehydro-3-deoxyphosphooctonate aldolase (KDO 8-P synthase)